MKLLRNVYFKFLMIAALGTIIPYLILTMALFVKTSPSLFDTRYLPITLLTLFIYYSVFPAVLRRKAYRDFISNTEAMMVFIPLNLCIVLCYGFIGRFLAEKEIVDSIGMGIVCILFILLTIVSIISFAIASIRWKKKKDDDSGNTTGDGSVC